VYDEVSTNHAHSFEWSYTAGAERPLPATGTAILEQLSVAVVAD